MAPTSSAAQRRALAAKRKSAASRKPKSAKAQAPAARTRRAQPVVDLSGTDIDATAAGRRLPARTIILGVIAAMLLTMFLPSISTGIAQYQQIAALERDIEVTEQEVADLKERQEQLKDPDYLAQRAREDYHYAKDGEEVYIVIDDTGEEVAAKTAAAGAGEKRTVRKQPWYIELVDSLKAVGFATEESP